MEDIHPGEAMPDQKICKFKIDPSSCETEAWYCEKFSKYLSIDGSK